MKKVLLTLALSLLLLSPSCDNDDDYLWNDLRVDEKVYHFKQIEFRQDSLVVCTGMPHGVVTWRFSLADGTRITRLFMLQQSEGWHGLLNASQGRVIVELNGSQDHDGSYRGIQGQVDIYRHEFKTIIEMHKLRLVHDSSSSDTIDINDGYLSFDLTLF